MRPTKAIINLSALRQNYKRIQQLAAGSHVMAVVKANAYGHGLAPIAQALQGVDMFAVATLEEALVIRERDLNTPILLLEGFFQADELDLIEQHNLQIVVHHWPQIHALSRYSSQAQNKAKKPLKVWVKIDSGMNRLGFVHTELDAVIAALSDIGSVADEVALMSHFASADDTSDSFSSEQLTQFDAATSPSKYTSTIKSMANSAAILSYKESHFDWVRPGLLLYGCSPIEGRNGAEFGLEPVMSLESQLLAVKTLKAGQSTGYGRHWFARSNTRIGLVAIGYGDGYPRHAKNGTPVWINGREVPLVGRVSMDMLAVDLGSDSDDNTGDRVVLWGKELPMERVAPFMDTIPYTLCCGVTSRVKFDYIEHD